MRSFFARALAGALIAATATGALAVTARMAHAQPAPAKPPPGTLTRPPSLVTFVEAAYPESEKAAGRTAEVVLALTIGPDGRVVDATVHQSGGAAFDAAAVAAARQFLFSPAEIDGAPSQVRILYRYAFTLTAEAPTTASFAGVVRDRVTGAPVEGATVALGDGREVVTGADGRFTFDDVKPGKLSVSIAAPGQTPVLTEEAFEAGRRIEASYDLALTPEPGAEGEEADDLEIVVTAPPLVKDVTSVEVGQDEARKVPGAQGDVLQVVKNLPGVGRAAAGSGAIVVWGAAPEDTRVYVEGVRVPLLYHLGGVRSVVQSDLVRSVELVPGGWGAAYGRGLGGLVTVRLVPLDDATPHGSVSVDVLDTAASIRTPVGEPLRAAVGARWGWAHRLVEVVSDEDVGELFPVPRYLDGQVRAAWLLSPRSSVELGVLASYDEVERVVGSSDPASVRSDSRQIGWGRLYLKYAAQLDDGAEVTITPSIGRDDLESAQRFGAVTTRVATESDLYALRASWRGRIAEESEGLFAGATATVGLDAEATRSRVRRSGSIGAPAREGDARVFGQRPPDQVGEDTWETWTGSPAPFAELDAAFLGGMAHVIPGVRLEPFALATSRQTPEIGNTPSIGLFDQEIRVEPRVAARVRPAPPLEIRGAWGLYHQQPAPEDLSAVFGNPALTPAEAHHFLGGVNLALGAGLDVDLVGFTTRSSDLVVRSSREQPLLARALVARGEGRAYGGQLLLRRQAQDDGFFGWISYGLSRSERRAGPDAPWRLFDYDQTHVLTAVASYELPLGFEVGSRVRVASGFPRTSVTGAYYDARTDAYQPTFGAVNDDRLPTFVQVDLRLSKTFDLGQVDVEAYLDVQNVTNHENVEDWVYSDDFSERGEITGVPILPVLGVRSSW